MPNPPPRAVFFVDGFNLYHSISEAAKLLPGQQLKWLDLPSLCKSYLHQIGNGAILSGIHYFTAFADHLHDRNPGKPQRHRAFVRALTARKVNAHISRFRRRKVWSHELDRWIAAYEEKETDVAIACQVLTLAMEDQLDVAVLVTGDSDFAPVYRAFSKHFAHKQLIFAFPFARASKELKQLSNQSFTISKEGYAKFQLPDKVRLPSGKFVRIPDVWKT
jgi:hypothetical protein